MEENEEKKVVKLVFKYHPKEEQLKYLVSIMATLRKNWSAAKTKDAKENIQHKIDVYGSIIHELDKNGKLIKRIYKPTKTKSYVNRFISFLKRAKG